MPRSRVTSKAWILLPCLLAAMMPEEQLLQELQAFPGPMLSVVRPAPENVHTCLAHQVALKETSHGTPVMHKQMEAWGPACDPAHQNPICGLLWQHGKFDSNGNKYSQHCARSSGWKFGPLPAVQPLSAISVPSQGLLRMSIIAGRHFYSQKDASGWSCLIQSGQELAWCWVYQQACP